MTARSTTFTDFARAPAWTPGPWRYETDDGEVEGNVFGPNGEHIINQDLGGTYQLGGGRKAVERDMADGRLIAAAPDLYSGCSALRGLIQLILGRDDLTPELRAVLTDNHRIDEADAAMARAHGETP